jgi:peptidoglycan/xylan/chitin deacetylase (PgdA/CDA1 family)
VRPQATRALRWTAGILGAVVLVVAAVVATFFAQLAGGWDEVFDTTKPLPDDPQVVAARAAGANLVDAETQRVIDDVVLPTLTQGWVAQPAPTGAAAVSADSAVGLDSGCVVGTHDWKRDDPFDLSCIEVRRTVLAASDAAFAADMTRLDEALTADGWRPRTDGSDLPAVVAEAHAQGDDTPSPAEYRNEEGPFDLIIMFEYIDTYTGRRPPALAPDQYAVMVGITHESFGA